MTEAAPRPSTPWHLWVVGILALLWNAFGAYDYLMTQTQNEAYMSNFTPEQLEYFYSFPAWVVSFWALAVWGGVLGSVLLLIRKSWATPVFLVSLVSMVITTIHNFLLSNGLEVMGGAFPLIFTAVIFLVALGLWFYARAMQRRGVLT
ncbi:MAG: hypothetical protein SX243_01515 [Acidobacteriota bacterium]|nr:hypothetical protein [Acidobacteriota bacterium]